MAGTFRHDHKGERPYQSFHGLVHHLRGAHGLEQTAESFTGQSMEHWLNQHAALHRAPTAASVPVVPPVTLEPGEYNIGFDPGVEGRAGMVILDKDGVVVAQTGGGLEGLAKGIAAQPIPHGHDWDVVDGWPEQAIRNHIVLSHPEMHRPSGQVTTTEMKAAHYLEHEEQGTGRPVVECGAVYDEGVPPCSVDAAWPHEEHSNGEWHWRHPKSEEHPEPANAVMAWADAAQYRSEPMPNGGKMSVTLLSATPDPLGVLAAICGMYVGRVTRDLGEVTDAQRRAALADMLATELNGPLSAVQFVFLVEGVDRAFTHQAVRQQQAFFAQESMRFAVKDGLASEIPLPPSLAGLPEDDPQVRIWRKALLAAEDAYEALVAAGMPAEEARGLAPHATTTRYYYSVNLKGLLIEASKRTCTQAQFHWRQMFSLMAKAMREYRSPLDQLADTDRGAYTSDAWQFELISDQLRPHCYQTGSCGFMAKFDRGCTIRERVELNAKAGRPPHVWHHPQMCHEDCSHPEVEIEPIQPREWAADPGAART